MIFRKKLEQTLSTFSSKIDFAAFVSCSAPLKKLGHVFKLQLVRVQRQRCYFAKKHLFNIAITRENKQTIIVPFKQRKVDFPDSIFL